MPGIALLVNPRARRNRVDPSLAARLARFMGDDGLARAAATHDELVAALEAFRAARVDVLAVLGGDGTNHVVLTHLLRVYRGEPLPAVAVLRGGTMNTQANSLRIPRRGPERLFRDLVDRYRHHHAPGARGSDRHDPLTTCERSVLLAGPDDRTDPRACFLFGTGAIRGFISEYERGSALGPSWAAKVLGQAALDVMKGRPTPVAERWEGTLHLEGVVEEGGADRSFSTRSYFSIGAGAIDQIGLGFRPYYRAGSVPGRFHLLGIHTSALGFVKSLPTIWRGRPMGPAHTEDLLVRRAVLEAKSGVVQYMCDGEVLEVAGPLVLAQGPRVRILADDPPGPRSLDRLAPARPARSTAETGSGAARASVTASP